MRIIIHMDMDAFFAAVEERNRPRLKGLPIVVGADPKGGKGRGVVSTANYKAREYGIHSAMPISLAWRLAKKAEAEGKLKTVFIGGSSTHAGACGEYDAVSRAIMEYVRPLGRAFEQASVDEAYLELEIPNSKSQITKDPWNYAEQVAKRIKKNIFKKEKLTCSIGIAPNKLIAKIASDMRKPDGLTVVRPEDVQKFLDPLLVRNIPGIGPKSEAALLGLGVRTVRDLRNAARAELALAFGKWGEGMWESARGIDESELVLGHEAKSVGAQETLEEDTLDSGVLVPLLTRLAKNVYTEAEHEGASFRTVSITVRFADFETKTRARSVPVRIKSEKEFAGEALKLFLPFLDKRENPKRKKIRLVGVRAEHFLREQPLF
ncbi:MAG: DNA polymerase IV [bacterium]|nr:DNA polymerase IV [bacterium]